MFARANREHADRRSERGLLLLLLRWAFTLATAAVVVAGHTWFVSGTSARRPDRVFALFLLIDLVPAGIYGWLVRERTTTLISGGLLVLMTGSSWLIAVVSTNDFRMGAPTLGWFAALTIASVAALNDLLSSATPGGSRPPRRR